MSLNMQKTFSGLEPSVSGEKVGEARLWSVAALIMISLAVTANLVAVYLVGAYAWDDGSITLAYARTIAEGGIFALNHVSEVAEGSSSLLFLAIMAGLHRLFHFGFEGIILASQLVTFTFVVATLLLVFFELRTSIGSIAKRAFLVGLFGLFPVFTTEIMNGMEMSLMAFLFMALYMGFSRRSGWIYVPVALLVLVRFESIFYLVFAFSAYALFRRDERARAIRVVLFSLAAFACVAAWRWWYFGDFFPNTVWAKMHPPYSLPGSPGEKALRKLLGLGEFLQVTAFFLVPALAFAALRTLRTKRIDLAVPIITSFAVFSVISGKNWGYDGRMFLASLPIIFILLAKCLASPEISTYPTIGKIMAGRRPAVIFGFLVCAVVAAIGGNRLLAGFNAQTGFMGAHHQGLLSESLDRRVMERWGNKSPYSRDWFGPSPANFRKTGMAAEKIREILQLPKIVFLVPDVGGSSLCCDRVQIVDLGLLTNRHLAKNGYQDFANYLQEVNPDLIETHTVWSEGSKIYESTFFQQNYLPAILDNNFVWIRKDHFARLKDSPAITVSEDRKPLHVSQVRYAAPGYDTEYVQSRPETSITRFTTR